MLHIYAHIYVITLHIGKKQKSDIVADKDLNGDLVNTLQTCRDG